MRYLIFLLTLSFQFSAQALDSDTPSQNEREARAAVRTYQQTKGAESLGKLVACYVQEPMLYPFLLRGLPVDEQTVPTLIRLVRELPNNSKLKSFVYTKLASGPESLEVVRLWRASLLDSKEDTDVRIAVIALMAECKWVSAQLALTEAFELVGEEKIGRDEKWRDRILGNTINGKHLEVAEKLFAAHERIHPTSDQRTEQHKQALAALRGEVAQRKASGTPDRLERIKAEEAWFRNLALKTNTISQTAALEQLATFSTAPVLQRLELAAVIGRSQIKDEAVLHKIDELIESEPSGIIKSRLILAVAGGLPEARQLAYFRTRLAQETNPEVKRLLEMMVKGREGTPKGKANEKR